MDWKGGKIIWVGWAVSVLSTLLFIMSATFKFMGGPQIEEGFQHLGFPMSLAKPLGVLELSCVAIYLIPQTAVLGAILLTGYLGGAICTHLRVGDPFYVQVLLGMFVWLGIYLREPRLHPIVPLRR